MRPPLRLASGHIALDGSVFVVGTVEEVRDRQLRAMQLDDECWLCGPKHLHHPSQCANLGTLNIDLDEGRWWLFGLRDPGVERQYRNSGLSMAVLLSGRTAFCLVLVVIFVEPALKTAFVEEHRPSVLITNGRRNHGEVGKPIGCGVPLDTGGVGYPGLKGDHLPRWTDSTGSQQAVPANIRSDVVDDIAGLHGLKERLFNGRLCAADRAIKIRLAESDTQPAPVAFENRESGAASRACE